MSTSFLHFYHFFTFVDQFMSCHHFSTSSRYMRQPAKLFIVFVVAAQVLVLSGVELLPCFISLFGAALCPLIAKLYLHFCRSAVP